MKNNYRIINFLRKLFKLFLWASIVNVVIVVFFVSLDFFSSTEKNGDHLPVNEEENIVSGITSVDINTKVGWVYNYSKDEVSSFHISHPIEALLLSIIVFFVFIYSHNFFVELQKGCKTGCLFFASNYFRVKKIGFLLLSMVLYTWIKGAVMFGLGFIESAANEGSFSFTLDSSDLSSLITVLVIFVFAEIYRTGIEMKEESEFTI